MTLALRSMVWFTTLLVLLVLCGPSVASASTVAYQDAMRALVADIHPHPAAWSDPTSPWTTWPGIVALSPPGYLQQHYFDLVFTEATLDPAVVFNTSGLLNFTALPVAIPLRRIEVQSMNVLIDPTQLPSGLYVLNITRARSFMPVPHYTWDAPPLHVNLTALPVQLTTLVLRECGLIGVVDLFNCRLPIDYIDLGGNPQLWGGVDASQLLIGANAPQNARINLQNTSIDFIPLIQNTKQLSVTTAPFPTSPPPGANEFWSFYVGEGTTVLPYSTVESLVLPYSYYCADPVVDPSDFNNFMIDILQVYSEPGKLVAMRDHIRMLRNTTTCRQMLQARSLWSDPGYIRDSPAWASNLALCMPEAGRSYRYALKGNTVTDSVEFYAANTSRLQSLSLCQSVANDPDYSVYYSAAVGRLKFVDLLQNTSTVVMRRYDNGTLRQCVYRWPMVFQTMFMPPCPPAPLPCPNTVFNFRHVDEHLGPCFLKPSEVGVDLPGDRWGGMGPYQNGFWFFAARNNVQAGRFALLRFGWGPIPCRTYSFVGAMAMHSIVVTPKGIYATMTTSRGVVSRSELWPQIGLYQTPLEGKTNVFTKVSNFTGLLAVLAPFLPRVDLQLTEIVAWDEERSGYTLDSAEHPTGYFVLVANSSARFEFIVGGEGAPVPVGQYCSSSNFGEGEVVLNVDADAFVLSWAYRRLLINMSHAQRPGSHHRKPNNVLVGMFYESAKTRIPLWMRPETGALTGSLPTVMAELGPCIPDASRTSVLYPPFNTGSYTKHEDGMIRIYDSAVPPNEFYMSIAECLGVPETIDLCDVPDSFRNATPPKALTTRCSLGICGKLRTVDWDVKSAFTSWQSGFAGSNTNIALDALIRSLKTEGIDSGACVGSCYLKSDACGPMASWLMEVAACIISRGGVTHLDVPIPQLPDLDACADGDKGREMLRAALDFVSMPFPAQQIRVECFPDRSARVWAVHDPRSDPVVELPLGEHVGVAISCTTCDPLVVEGSVAMPIEILAISAFLNVLLILVANYLIDPFIGPRLVKLKMLLFAPALLLSHRQRRHQRALLQSQLDPQFVEMEEVEAHVRTIVERVEQAYIDSQPAGPRPDAAQLEREQKLFEYAYRSILVDHDRYLNLESITSSVMGNLIRIREACGRWDFSTRRFFATLPDSDAGTSQNGRSHAGAPSDALFGDFDDGDVHAQQSRAAADVARVDERGDVDGTSMSTTASAPLLAAAAAAGDDEDVQQQQYTSVASTNDDDRRPSVHGGVNTSGRNVAEDAAGLRAVTVPEGPSRQRPASADDPFSPGSALSDGSDFDFVSVSDFRKQSIVSRDSIGRALLALDQNVDAEWIAFARATDWLDRRTLLPKEWLLFLQSAVIAAYFISCIVSGVHSGGVGDRSVKARRSKDWRVYEAVYFAFVNSTMPGALLVNAAFMTVYGRTLFRRSRGKLDYARRWLSRLPTNLYLVFIGLLLLPPLVTHCLPMAVFFAPLTIAIVVAVVLAVVLTRVNPPPQHRVGSRLAYVRALGARLVLRVVVTMAAVAALQFTFNYGVLVYDRDEAWDDVWRTEWHSRSLLCAADVMQTSGQDLFHRLMMIFS